jgi:hypothetical protein
MDLFIWGIPLKCLHGSGSKNYWPTPRRTRSCNRLEESRQAPRSWRSSHRSRARSTGYPPTTALVIHLVYRGHIETGRLAISPITLPPPTGVET